MAFRCEYEHSYGETRWRKRQGPIGPKLSHHNSVISRNNVGHLDGYVRQRLGSRAGDDLLGIDVNAMFWRKFMSATSCCMSWTRLSRTPTGCPKQRYMLLLFGTLSWQNSRTSSLNRSLEMENSVVREISQIGRNRQRTSRVRVEYFRGHTTLQWLREIQRTMSENRVQPEQFRDRIINVSMSNDTDWTKDGNEHM